MPSEIDWPAATWIIPATRMKSGREHRVPLAVEALGLLSGLPREDANPYLFMGAVAHRGLSLSALHRVLRSMRPDLTVHGFRSSFRDWAAETTSHSSEVVEMALAHAVGSRVEAAYRRGDLLEKRRALMSEWAKFLG